MKIISKMRINKTNGQKTVTIPKQKETETWKESDIIEVKKVKIN
ncbi:MAG: hypothetical protein WC758_08405 [Candidatus Woesearchaeota archaeon]|jgi:hypothetical protein